MAQTMVAELKAGLVGLGKQMEDAYLGLFTGREALPIAAVADAVPERSRPKAAQLDVPGYTDTVTMIEESRPDYLIVVLPHNQYLSVVETAAKTKIPVLQEKPLANTLDAGLRIKEISETANLLVMVSTPRRFHPLFQRFQRAVAALDPPLWLGGHYTQLVTDLPSWRLNPEKAGGGCLVDMGYHLVDLVLWNVGLPDEVTAHVWPPLSPNTTEDTIQIEFAGGSDVRGSLFISSASNARIERIWVQGQRATVEVVKHGKRVRLLHNGECLEEDGGALWDTIWGKQVRHFQAVIAGSERNELSPRIHVQHMAMIEACYQSARNNAAVAPRRLLPCRAR